MLIVLLLEIFLVNIMIDFVERIWEGKKVFFCVNEIKCVCVKSRMMRIWGNYICKL